MGEPQRPQRQQYNRALAEQVVRGGGQFTPEQQALFDRLSTPAQRAQFQQQQYAQVTQPAPAAGAVATDAFVPPAAGGYDPNTGAMPPPAPYNPARGAEGSGPTVDRYAQPAPRTVYGRAPNGGGGDATFGTPGRDTRTSTPRARINPDLTVETDETGRPVQQSVEQGGASSRVFVGPLNENGIPIYIDGVFNHYIPPQAEARGYTGIVAARTARSAGADAPVDLTDPNNPIYNQAMGSAIAAQLQGALAPYGTPGQGGPGEPRMSARLDQEIRFPGQMSATTAARLSAADQAVEGAYGDAEAANQALVVGHSLAGQAVGNAQSREATAMEARAVQRQQRVQAGLQDLHRRLDDVAGMRVDVNEAFGGFGGRMGAAVAVALGQLGSALGGGENAALAIINASVDRNLAMQRSNIDGARADASARGNAFGMMVDSLGDEEAAIQAARALHLTALATSMNGLINGLATGPAAAARALQQRVLQQSLVARQAAAEIADTATEASLRTEFRGGQAAVQGQIAGMLGPGQGQAPQGAPATAPGPARQQQVPAQRPTATGSGPRTQTGTPNARPQGPMSAPAAGASAAQPGPFRGRVPSPDEMAEAVREFQEHVVTPAVSPGFRWATTGTNQQGEGGRTVADAARLHQQNTQGQNERAALGSTQALILDWGTAVPEILRAHEQWGVEFTNREPSMAEARAQAEWLTMELRHMITGAAFSESEAAAYERLLPELGEWTPATWTGAWDSFRNRWVGAANSILRSARNRLAVRWALEPDSPVEPLARNVLQRQVRAADEADAAPQAPTTMSTPREREVPISVPGMAIPVPTAVADYARDAFDSARRYLGRQ